LHQIEVGDLIVNRFNHRQEAHIATVEVKLHVPLLSLVLPTVDQSLVEM
jgi:hypothetical protein